MNKTKKTEEILLKDYTVKAYGNQNKRSISSLIATLCIIPGIANAEDLTKKMREWYHTESCQNGIILCGKKEAENNVKYEKAYILELAPKTYNYMLFQNLSDIEHINNEDQQFIFTLKQGLEGYTEMNKKRHQLGLSSIVMQISQNDTFPIMTPYSPHKDETLDQKRNQSNYIAENIISHLIQDNINITPENVAYMLEQFHKTGNVEHVNIFTQQEILKKELIQKNKDIIDPNKQHSHFFHT